MGAMSRQAPPDPSLHRIGRDSVVACLAMAVVALIVRGGRLDGALGVIGGGLLIAFSYSAIRDGVDAIVEAAGRRVSDAPGAEVEGLRPDEADTPPIATVRRRRPRIWVVVKLFARYALLAAGAYVMLIVLHLHPVGLVAGVSSIFIATLVEAVRLARRPTGRGQVG